MIPWTASSCPRRTKRRGLNPGSLVLQIVRRLLDKRTHQWPSRPTLPSFWVFDAVPGRHHAAARVCPRRELAGWLAALRRCLALSSASLWCWCVGARSPGAGAAAGAAISARWRWRGRLSSADLASGTSYPMAVSFSGWARVSVSALVVGVGAWLGLGARSWAVACLPFLDWASRPPTLDEVMALARCTPSGE